jgi:hypothetical protein
MKTSTTLTARIFIVSLSTVFALGFAASLGACANEKPYAGAQKEVETGEKEEWQAEETAAKVYFEPYLLRAVAYLYENYKLLGYDKNLEYTHTLPFGDLGVLKHSGPKTMCVAAQMEVIVTALDMYSRETGDKKPYKFLPKKAWEGYTINDLKGHMWVNSKFDSYGGANALVNFGMGEHVAFEQLVPGSLLNWDRANGTGHAAIMVSFIDKDGKEYDKHNSAVIGFKYFSSQGLKTPHAAGLDYRYAVFNQHGCPTNMPYLTDCGVLYNKNRKSFNTGRMWAPVSWVTKRRNTILAAQSDGEETVFNSDKYTGE